MKPDPIPVRRSASRTYYKGQDVQSVRLTKQQESELFLSLKADPDNVRIVERIVVSYMAFALRQARKDMGQRSDEARQKVGLSEDDAISAANLGLMHAIRRFDPKNGARFTTYAGWWIKKYLAEARYEAHLIKVTCSDRKLFSRFSKMVREGLRPHEIAFITGHAVEEVERVLQIAQGRQDSYDQWSRVADICGAKKAGDTAGEQCYYETTRVQEFNAKAQDNHLVEGDTPEELAKKELLEKLEYAKMHLGKDELSYLYDYFSRSQSVSEMARNRGKTPHEVKAKIATLLSTLKVCLQA